MLNPRLTCTKHTHEFVISSLLNLGGNAAKKKLQIANLLNSIKRKCVCQKGRLDSVKCDGRVCQTWHGFVSILKQMINTIYKGLGNEKNVL